MLFRSRNIPWRRKWQSTPALLPGKSHGQRSLIGYSPWGRKESEDRKSVVRESMEMDCGSDSGRRRWHPLQHSCLENPTDGGAWWAAVHLGHEESDTIELLHFHFSLSYIGEGKGNPLQCSCLENPRDGGAWWTAGYGVAQSRTRLKRLSSSSSNNCSTLLTRIIQWTQEPVRL